MQTFKLVCSIIANTDLPSFEVKKSKNCFRCHFCQRQEICSWHTLEKWILIAWQSLIAWQIFPSKAIARLSRRVAFNFAKNTSLLKTFKSFIRRCITVVLHILKSTKNTVKSKSTRTSPMKAAKWNVCFCWRFGVTCIFQQALQHARDLFSVAYDQK